ncbi:hypothetical protein TNCV_1133641 [Trichonephila clavipes]|nr:hypothetical protein TNCV_1133641 [Trichonephila clavipes]
MIETFEAQTNGKHDSYGNAEVDMPLRCHRRQYGQLSEFERGRIIRMMEAEWSAWRVARQIGHLDLSVRRGLY